MFSYSSKNNTTATANRNNVLFFQPKLSINQPNDIYEQEADAMAEHVMNNTSGTSSYNNSFFKPSVSSVQRKCAHCEEEEKKAQRKENNSNATEASPETENYIQTLSGGQSLNNKDKNFFESGMGYDFSNVRLHTDSIAAKSAQSVNALAYTSGNNIVFNQDQYAPGTDSGKRLLAHELTHVVQQNTGTIQPKLVQRDTPAKTPAANWWNDKGIGIKPETKFWDDMRLFFPKDIRKFSGSGMDNISNIEVADDGMVRIGKGYWEENDPMKRKASIAAIIEKRDEKRFDEGRIDNEDLTNDKITGKLKALGGNDIKTYIAKLAKLSPFVKNDKVIDFLNGDDKTKTQIVKDATDLLLDWKFANNRLTDTDFRDERINAQLRGLSNADKLDKEAKAKDFSQKTGESTSNLQSFLHNETITSTPLPEGVTPDSAGGFTMHLPNIDVIVLPDISGGKGNDTAFSTNLPTTSYNFDADATSGLITKFYRLDAKKKKIPINMPSKLQVTIRTRFADLSTVDAPSGYGRGTTDQDKKWGTTTLRFHEGSHGKGFIDYIQSHSWPSIVIGSVKQADLKTISAQFKEMKVESCQLVDQVGFTQDQYLATPTGIASGMVSCNN